MKIKCIIEKLLKLNLDNWKLIQINLNSLVLFKTKYKFTDCIYVNINEKGANLRYERVFDNKYLNLPIERLFIYKMYLDKEVDLIDKIKEII